MTNFKLKMQVPSEEAEQMTFVEWVRRQPDIEPYVIHIANQRKANLAYGVKLKRLGVRAGVSDIFVAKPNLGYSGLWLEFKRREGGVVSACQQEWIDKMIAVGYAAYIVKGYDEAISRVLEYFGKK